MCKDAHYMASLYYYNYVIEDVPPSNNKFIGRNNIWEYQEYKKLWQKYILMLCLPRPEKPIKRARVIIDYYFKDKRRRDPDNFSGKMILDGLVRAGILEDDSFNNIELVLKAEVDKEKPRTEITVKEL